MNPGDYPSDSVILIVYLVSLLFIAVINTIFGIIAVNMAKKRKLNTTPAFFAGFFGTIITLFIIAMFPIQKDDEK